MTWSNSLWSYPPPPHEYYSYDAAGNRIDGGRSWDGENRLLGYPGTGFLYDGNSRRFRKTSGGTKIFYVYSVMGFMLVEDDWTAGTTQNQIYFNGQLIATHGQDEIVRLLFKDHLGSTRSVVTVTKVPGWLWGHDWETTAVFAYNPYGDYSSSWIQDPQVSKVRFTGKERESNGLDYFGARYYDSTRTQRWMSPDPLTARIYDPLSLNKYTYVRNDPVNRIDPDGRLMAAANFFSIDWPEEGPPTVTWTYYPERGGSYGGGGNGLGGSGPDSGSDGGQRIDPRVGTAESVKEELGKAVKRGDCANFMNLLIAQLKKDGSVSSDFSIQKLINNIGDKSTITVDLTGRGRYAHVEPGTDHIQLSDAGLLAQTPTRGRPEYTQDLWSRLLHEGFHLNSTGKIDDETLATALEGIGKLVGARSWAGDSSAIGRTFALHCGPNAGKQ
jgi:RHS repeat-associated protein